MRRKDILIISAILIVISFCTVFAIYYMKNDGNILPEKPGQITEIAENEENESPYYSNGWDKEIVKEIRHNVPVPVGFTYVEGEEKTGLIIKNDESGEEYVWVPIAGASISEEEYAKIFVDLKLEENTEETRENTQKYSGFYVAIDRNQNTDTNQIKEKLANMSEEDKRDLMLDNKSKTSIAETHTVTSEELATIISWDSEIKNMINIDKMRALTLSASTKDEYLNKKEVQDILEEYLEKIDDAKKYLTKECNIKVSEIDEKISKSYREIEEKYEKLKNAEGEVLYHTAYYEEGTELFEDISKSLLNDFELSKTQKEAIEDILDVEELDDEEDEEDNDKENNETITVEVDERLASKHQSEDVYIPLGFTYKEGTVKTGFKITNGDNLNYIWIPVEELAGKAYLLDGITDEEMKKAEDAIKTKFKENMTEEYESEYSDYLENASDITEDNKGLKDNNEEYKELLVSIAKYGGFYISEAELGYDENGHMINKYRPMIKTWGEEFDYNFVSNGNYFRNVKDGNKDKENKNEEFKKAQNFTLTYDDAVAKSKELYNTSLTVNSHLTYGLEYNAVINYLIDREAITQKQAFEDSTKIGKYQALEDGTKSLWEKESYINKIYGLAGNLAELTQEIWLAEDEEGKEVAQAVLRGGRWSVTGTEEPLAWVGHAENSTLREDEETIGFRACLYIKPEVDENYEEALKKIESARDDVVEDLKDYIDGKEENEHFTTDKTGDKYKLELLNEIVQVTENKVEGETSERYLIKILDDGKFVVDQHIYQMDKIENYPEENYDFGDMSDECNKIKSAALNEIKALRVENPETAKEINLINANGKPTTHQIIVEKAIGEIDAKIEAQKEAIKAEIEKIANDFYSTWLPEKAEEYEWRYFDEIWKTDYEKIKAEGQLEILKETTVEEANKVCDTYKEKINSMIETAVKNKDAEIEAENAKKEAIKAEIVAVANDFYWNWNPEKAEEYEWRYFDEIWKADYEKMKADGQAEILKATTKEEANTICDAQKEKINSMIETAVKNKDAEIAAENEKNEAKNAEIAAVADDFYWNWNPEKAEEYEWKYFDEWEDDYVNWKKTGQAEILKATTKEEADTICNKQKEIVNGKIESIIKQKIEENKPKPPTPDPTPDPTPTPKTRKDVLEYVENNKGYEIHGSSGEERIHIDGKEYALLSDNVTFISTDEFYTPPEKNGTDTWETAKNYATGLGGNIASEAQMKEIIGWTWVNGTQSNWISDEYKYIYSPNQDAKNWEVKVREKDDETHGYYVVIHYTELPTDGRKNQDPAPKETENNNQENNQEKEPENKREALKKQAEELYSKYTDKRKDIALKVVDALREGTIIDDKFSFVDSTNVIAFKISGTKFAQLKPGSTSMSFVSVKEFTQGGTRGATYDAARKYVEEYFDTSKLSEYGFPSVKDYEENFYQTYYLEDKKGEHENWTSDEKGWGCDVFRYKITDNNGIIGPKGYGYNPFFGMGYAGAADRDETEYRIKITLK